jgi:hypothetical protein
MKMNWKPITEEDYDAALGALPPRVQLHDAFLLGEPYDWRPCTATAGRMLDTYHPYAQIRGAFYKGEPVTVPEFVQGHAKGFSL